MNAFVVLATEIPEGSSRLLGMTIPLPPWTVVLLLAAVGVISHFGLRSLVHQWVRKTETDLDDAIVESVGRAFPLAVLLSILYVSVEMIPEKHAALKAASFRVVGLAFVVLLFWVLASLVLKVLERWAARNPQFTPVHAPVRFVFKGLVCVVAIVTVLAYLNVDVTALATTLGIGGLAVALALKDTLENFFAGLHVMADRPIGEGDWVIVHETGDRGVVLKVGWRTTRLRTIDNNVLVVPNTKISSGLLTNITARDPSVHVRVQVGVAYDSDPDRVAAVLEDEARRLAAEVPALRLEPPPEAFLHPGFGPSSLDFTLRVTVAAMEDSLPIQDRLRRRILRRLRAEGIGIPYPTTEVRLRR